MLNKGFIYIHRHIYIHGHTHGIKAEKSLLEEVKDRLEMGRTGTSEGGLQEGSGSVL